MLKKLLLWYNEMAYRREAQLDWHRAYNRLLDTVTKELQAAVTVEELKAAKIHCDEVLQSKSVVPPEYRLCWPWNWNVEHDTDPK